MEKKGFKQKAVVSLLLLLLLVGCAGKKEKGLKTVEGDPEVLYKQGLGFFNRQLYKLGLEKFEQIKSNFPDSPPFTVWAELKIADSHFLSKQYVEAASAYEEFKKIHPTHDEIPPNSGPRRTPLSDTQSVEPQRLDHDLDHVRVTSSMARKCGALWGEMRLKCSRCRILATFL